ncbi:MAG: type II toxin-antitoxin system VapC family toxin [Treponema sp.]|nr:type II toxin-antitoxin system VapC family toxin [Treponema sp.]
MKYLLDTCVISEAIRPLPEPSVLAWLAVRVEEDLYLPTLVLGELMKGIERLESGLKRSRLESWAVELEARFGSRLVAIDGEVALKWGRLAAQLEQRGIALPVIDGLIASCALNHGMVLATRNIRDFAETGVELFNPWDFEG